MNYIEYPGLVIRILKESFIEWSTCDYIEIEHSTDPVEEDTLIWVADIFLAISHTSKEYTIGRRVQDQFVIFGVFDDLLVGYTLIRKGLFYSTTRACSTCEFAQTCDKIPWPILTSANSACDSYHSVFGTQKDWKEWDLLPKNTRN